MALLKITDLRKRVGLLETDVSLDTKITDCYTVALLLVEDYLDRRILLETFIEQFTCVHHAQVKAWPIDTVISIDGNTAIPELRIDKERGIIYNVNWDNTLLEYKGGWPDQNIPAVIVMTINELFDKLWATTTGFGTDTPVVQSDAEVKKFSINGVSVEYFQSGEISTSSSASIIPQRFRNLLDYYRRESLIGVG